MRFIKYLFYILVVLLLAGGYTFYFNYWPLIVNEIKAQVYKVSQVELEFSSVRLKSLFPLGIQINSLKATRNNFISFAADKIEIKFVNTLEFLKRKSHQPEIELQIINFKLNVSYSNINKNTTSVNSASATAPLKISSLKNYLPKNNYVEDIKLHLKLQKGYIEYSHNQQTLGELKLKSSETLITSLEEPINFTYEGTVKSKFDALEIEYPFTVSTKIEIRNNWINLLNTQFDILGIENKITLKYHTESKYLDFSCENDIPNLNKLPLSMVDNFPINKLFGSLKSQFKAVGYMERKPQITGDIDLKIISADIELKKGDLSAAGNLNLTLKSQFSYQNKLTINQIKWNADLSKTFFEKSNLIKKQVSTPFITEGSGSFNEDFNLKNFRLVFNNITASAQGILSLNNESNFKFEIPEFDLKNIEKSLLLLPQYPITGKVAAKGEVQGFLKDPKNLNLNIELFKIENFKYTLYKKINDVEIEGPIRANLKGSLLIDKQVALKGDISGYIDAEDLSIRKNGDSLKVSEDPLKVDFKTSVINKSLHINQLDVKSLIGSFTISGKPPIAFNDYLSLTLKVHKINWARIRNFIPKSTRNLPLSSALINSIKNINATAALNVSGSISEKDILNSPLKMSGQTQVHISEINFPWDLKLSDEEKDAPTKSEVKLVIPEPFIKSNPLLGKLTFENQLIIDKITFKDQQSISGINLNSKIENENFLQSGQINNFFDGKLVITNIQVPLTKKDPLILFDVNSSSLNLTKASGIFLSEFQNIIKGLASFSASGKSHLPYSLNFKKQLEIKGQFSYQNGRIDTFNFAKLIKEKLLTLPNVATPQGFEKNPLEGSIKSEFMLKNQTISIDNFIAITKRKEEVQLHGTITPDLNMNMKANLNLVDLPLKGDFITANKDSHGRLTFPIEIKGNIKNPQWSFVGNTLEAMTQKYLQFERNRIVIVASKEINKKKEEANRAIQSEIHKQKSKLESEAKKTLNNLFK